jgi:hypothetical protein
MWVISEDLDNFSPRRKIFGGAKIRTSFGVEFSLDSGMKIVFLCFFHKFGHSTIPHTKLLYVNNHQIV